MDIPKMTEAVDGLVELVNSTKTKLTEAGFSQQMSEQNAFQLVQMVFYNVTNEAAVSAAATPVAAEESTAEAPGEAAPEA